MKKSIRYIRFRFLVIQLIVLLIMFFLMAGLFSYHFINQFHEFNRRQLESSSQQIARELFENFDKDPRSYYGLNIFAINRESGAYIIPRAIDSEANKVWESHERKLKYRMQKQENGWIEYPEVSFFKTFDQTHYMMRYFLIPGTDMILVVEKPIESYGSILKEVFEPLVILQILMLCLVGLLSFRFIENRIFIRVRKLISDQLETSFIDIAQKKQVLDKEHQDLGEQVKEEKVVPSETSIPENYENTVNDDPYADSLMAKQEIDLEARPAQIEETKFERPSKKPITRPVEVNDLSSKYPAKDAAQDDRPPIIPDEKRKQKEKPIEKVDISYPSTNQSELDHYKDSNSNSLIDDDQINSSVLKKMLKELREE